MVSAVHLLLQPLLWRPLLLPAVCHCADLPPLWIPTNVCRSPRCAHYTEQEAQSQVQSGFPGTTWQELVEASGELSAHAKGHPLSLQPAVAGKGLFQYFQRDMIKI